MVEVGVLCEMYRGGASIGSLVAHTGRSYSVIRRTLLNNGVVLRRRGLGHPMPKALSPEQEADVCFQYGFGREMQDLSTDFEVCISTIWLTLQRNGMKCRARKGQRAKYTHDRYYFHTMDREGPSYWAGFIAADGCVQSKGNSLSVGLAIKDAAHLDRLRADLKAENPVIRNTGRGTCCLQVTSRHIKEGLLKWNITPRKTYTLKWPAAPEASLRHFVRGYVDGDGCFWKGKEAWRANFSVVGNLTFLRYLQDYLASKCGLSHTKIQPGRGPSPLIGVMEYGGANQVLRIAHFLYDDATVFLARKKSVMLP